MKPITLLLLLILNPASLVESAPKPNSRPNPAVRADIYIPPNDFYVSPQGRDTWSGTLPAPNAKKTDGPFATPARARDAVRERIAAGLKADVRVLLRGGTYYLPAGLTFGPEDSGTAKHSVTYAAYPGEVPALIGGVKVTGWKQYRGEIWYASFPSLPDDPFVPRQVFENGRRLELARAPNTGYFRMEKPVEGQLKRAFVYAPGDLKGLNPAEWDLTDARVFLWPGHDWFSAEKRITKIDPATRTVTTGSDEGYEMRPGNRYLFRNVLELLDAPGEAVIRSREQRIYIRPRKTPILAGTVVASRAPTLLLIQGQESWPVRNLHFEGLDLSVSNGDVVKFSGAEDCSIRFCRIENGADRGVWLQGHARRITVYGNEIREHGYHGVALNGMGPGPGPKPAPDVNRDNVIENNHIHHCGRLVGHGYGVEIVQSGHNRIIHNHIHHMPRYGTTIKGNRFQTLKEAVPGVTWENHYDFLHSRHNLLAYNRIHHTNLDSQDTGAMESWGPGRDNTYDHNLIHDTGNAELTLQSGIYLDDATDHFTVTNNVIFGVRGAGGDQPIYAKGIGNRIVNNILIVGPTNAGGIRSLEMADERTDGHIYRRNIIYFERPKGDEEFIQGRFGEGIHSIHDPGTVRMWRIRAPADGEYRAWLYYAADNTFGAMDGRTTMAIGGGKRVPLTNLPNTGGWGTSAWSRGPAAVLELRRGEQILHWRNEQGGGLNWDATVLTTDPNWKPDGVNLPDPAKGHSLVVVQAEAAMEYQNPKGPRPVYGFDNWSDDRVRESDFNLFWNTTGGITIRGGPADGSFEKWRELFGGKFDRHSLVADPRFVDPAKRDYRLKPDSPALKLGFRPIDLSRVGLKPDFPKRLARE